MKWIETMTREEFREFFEEVTLDLEARGLIERAGVRNGQIAWRVTEAGLRSSTPPLPPRRSKSAARKRR